MFLIGAEYLAKPFKCIIFAPTKSQAAQDYTRFRALLSLWAKHGHELEYVENTKSRIEAINGNSVTILPLSKNSDIVGHSGNYLIFEEAQDLNDDAVENKAIPMGANFATPSIYIGTAGTQLCKFYTLILMDLATRYSCYQIIEMKRMQYERDKNMNHLNYEKNVYINQLTMTDDNFGRQFTNRWLLGENQYMLPSMYDELCEPKTSVQWNDDVITVFSLDLARKYDGCILTRLDYIPRLDRIEIYPCEQLPAGSYGQHYEYIERYLQGKRYNTFVFDTTGNQHVLPDLLVHDGVIPSDKYTPFIFTRQSKHDAYTMFDQYIKSKKIRYIGRDEYTRFELSLLVKKYNSDGTVSVSTPERKGWHDDRPCSIAMGIYTIHAMISQTSKQYYI